MHFNPNPKCTCALYDAISDGFMRLNILPWVNLLLIPVRDLYTKVTTSFNWKCTGVIFLYMGWKEVICFLFTVKMKPKYWCSHAPQGAGTLWGSLQVKSLHCIKDSHFSFDSKKDWTGTKSERHKWWANCRPAQKINSKKYIHATHKAF